MNDTLLCDALDDAYGAFQAGLRLFNIAIIDELAKLLDLIPHLGAKMLITRTTKIVLLESFACVFMVRHGALRNSVVVIYRLNTCDEGAQETAQITPVEQLSSTEALQVSRALFSLIHYRHVS